VEVFLNPKETRKEYGEVCERKNYFKKANPAEYGVEFVPAYDPRVLTKLNENVIIITAWGSKAVGLKGGNIVTYSAEQNDYSVLDQEAEEYTYTKVESGPQKTIK
jgi:hypothetical protein